MAANKELVNKRRALVYSEYDKLISKKHNGLQVYSYEYVLARVGEKTFYTPKYVEKILKNR